MDFRKKGQVEFVVVLALIIIAVVAVVLASRQAVITPPPTPGLPEEAKLVKDSVLNLIRAGAKDQLLFIYNQGGTISPSPSVKFGMFQTQIWSACDEKNIPDVAEEIGAGLWAYLRNNLEEKMDFYGKKTTFDFSNPKYEVDILKDRINIKVYLPTKVEDYDIRQPYEVSVASRLYDILDFSENFVDDQGKNRFLEVFTLASMMNSNPEHENWVPVKGVQIGCGNVLFKTREDILPGIKGIAKYTVSHTLWNNAGLKLAENPFYPIYGVGGKTYPDLEVVFSYPPSWDSEMDKYFSYMPEPLRVIPKPAMPMVPICMAPYAVSYTFRYPVIVMVKDDILNQWFNFAVMVDIENTQPGNCTGISVNESDYARICGNAECDIRVAVRNSTGSPVKGADVGFHICEVGVTDENGVVEGKIPCIAGELHVYKEGYRSFGDLFAPADLQNIEVVLKKVADSITVHFKGVIGEAHTSLGDGKFDTYTFSGGSKGLEEFGRKLTVFLSFSPEDPNYFTGEDTSVIITNYDTEGNLNQDVTTYGLQPIRYLVTALVTDDETDVPVGYINTSIELSEGENEIYVYLPLVLTADGEDMKEPGISPDDAEKVTDALVSNCGWSSPVSTKEQSC